MPNNALQRTEAGGGVFSVFHVLRRQPPSLSLSPLGDIESHMQPLTLARANQIVDRIQTIIESGGFLKPVALSKVGASSTAEALAALYLVTAETFQLAARNDNPRNREMMQDFVRAAGGTGMWIATLFRPDGQSNYPYDVGVDESVKESETIDSFVGFLRLLDPESSDYWRRVYARIGIANPMTSGHPVRDSFIRLVLLLVWYGVAGFIGLVTVGVSLVFAGSVGERFAAGLGGSGLAKVAGFLVTFVVLTAIAVGVGVFIGLTGAAIMKRWPRNPLVRLVEWVKAPPPNL